MPPGRYTGLYFLDEATAFAAGHRPCAECRRAACDEFRAVWSTLHPTDRSADDVDRTLHAERRADGGQRRHTTAYADLPDATLVSRDGTPWLVRGAELLRWTPGGYTDRVGRPDGTASVLTPPSLQAVLAAGWDADVPLLHPSAAG